MNILLFTEKTLKRHLKKRRSVTIALVVSFLITGIPYVENELDARDLRARTKENNFITPAPDGPGMTTSANKTDVINIKTPNKNGISHNKFIDFNVGKNNGVIFNNNASEKNIVSKTGGIVVQNKNLQTEADTILTEVTGTSSSNINGSVEIVGKKADFILANENGINVNGASFINTNGITLSTGKVTVEQGNIRYDVEKGNVSLNGIGTSGNYFNVYAKTIELHNEVSPLENESKPDITFVAGKNKLKTVANNLKNVEITSTTKEENTKYGIYASELGAMYGNNIKLISTGSGLGVKHEGTIFSEKDIEISSDGEIYINNLNSGKNIDIKGEKLITSKGNTKNNGLISAKKDINFALQNSADLNSSIQSTEGNISIKAKNIKNTGSIFSNGKLDIESNILESSGKLTSKGDLSINLKESGNLGSTTESTEGNVNIIGGNIKNSGIISAKNKLNVDVNEITNEKNAILKGSDLNLKAKNSFVNKGDIRENKENLNEFVDPNGKVKIEVTFGKLENQGNISSKNLSILTQELVNTLTGKIIVTDGNIVITSSLGDLINHGEIFSNKDIEIISGKDITNTGKLGANNLTIQALKGKFLNAGNISSIRELAIVVKSLVNVSDSKELEKYLEDFYSYSDSELKKVENIINSLREKINSGNKDENLKETLNHFENVKNNLLSIKAELSKTGKVGNISGKNIKIEATEDIENKGLINSSNDINILGKNINNSGIIQGENSVLLKSIETIRNSGRITANKDIKIDSKSFISEGNETLLNEYLETLKKFDKLELEKISKEIKELEKKLVIENTKELREKINELKSRQKELNKLKSAITAFSGLGVIESNNIVITTIDSLENNGILISKENTELSSKGDITNNGTASVGENLSVKGNNFTSNNLTVGGKLSAELNNNFKSKNLTSNGNINIKGNLINTGNLSTNKDLNITGDLKVDKNSNVSIKNNVKVSGGADLEGNLTTNGNLEVSDENRDFVNKGNLEVSGNLDINSKNVVNNNATIGGNLKIASKNNINNTGKLQVKNDVNISGNNFNNSGEIITEKDFTAKIENNFESNDLNIKGNLNIDSNNVKNNKNITVGKDININSNDGDIESEVMHSQGKTTLKGKDINIKKELISSGIDISGNLHSFGNISSKGNIDVTSRDTIDIHSKGKLVATGDINLNANRDITNKGMIVSNKNINVKSKGNSIINEKGTIWASGDVNLNAFNKIHNTLGTIESKGNMNLTSKEVINEAGNIKAGKKLDINANSVVNKSYVVEDIRIEGYTTTEAVTKWDDTFNYHLDYVKVEVPNIVDKSYVKDKATISSGEDLTIRGKDGNGKTNVLNESGTIASSKNIDIYGDVKNTTHKKDVSIDWILENTKVELYWETKLYGTNAHGNSGLKFKGSLKEALYNGYFNQPREEFYKSLTKTDNPLLNRALSSFLGPDWKGKNKPKPKAEWNNKGVFEYVATNAGGQIFAGGNITHSGGEFNNDGGQSGGNKDITINVGDENVQGIISNGKVNIGDINDIKEVGGVKQVHDVTVQKGEVTLNGVTIKAESGNMAGSIAVAGTINPIIFIETPTGENGIFKPATPKPNGIQPIYETNIEFIDPSKYFGSEYFFNQIGYDKNKIPSVIGDAYYEYALISKMIQQGLGYTGEITAEHMKALLDNALKFQNDLGLEIGQPLTPEQINKLDRDIIWYVEVEVNGQRTLTPQIYFSNKTRVDIATSQGSGGNTTIKAGGNIVTDNTGFNNTNGNITANGNIIVKSQGDINNNSYGGVSGGITSNKGNIALDANGDVNIIGGNVKGDNVLVSGNNVNIESTLTDDEKGNQNILDKGEIEGNNGIQIDAKKDVNIVGGNLVANGTEVKPEKEESFGGMNETPPEKPEVKKDVKYYEELFKKESKDIIEGDAGSININAKGDVNIKDMHTTSSKSESQLDSNGNYSEKSSIEMKSNGSNILGSNVNIKSDKNVNIKGSNIGTNDLLEENKDKNLKSGSINIDAKGDVNIEDSKDIYQENSSYKKTSMENGLLTTKWGNKETNMSLSKGSSLQTGGDLTISSGNNIKVQGSNLTSGGNTSLEAENNVDILDGRDKLQEKSTDNRYQVVGGGTSTTEKKASNSKGSNIVTGGDFTIKAKNDIKIVNGQISSSGDTKLKAGNNVSIEAGKNEYTEKTTSTNVGIFAEGSVGVGGVGVTGNASTSDMSAEGEISKEWGGDSQVGENLDGSNEKTPTTSGKPHMDQLVNSEIGLKVEHKKQEIEETTWSESQFQGNNITIESGNKVDIGGGDYKAKNDLNITGKSVESTKYEDKRVEKNEGFSVAVKQSQGVSSSVADTINNGIKMDQAIKSGHANTGVLVAQGVGSASNLIFNDLIGSFSKQSANVSIENNTKIDTSENITSMEGKNINIKSTEGDITLNGVEIKGKENVSLDSNKNINIGSAKKTSSEVGYTVDLEAQLEESAGYSALWGGNTDIGVGGSVNVDVTKNNSTEHINSQITSDGKLNIKSGGDTNIKGGELEGKKDVTVDVAGNLNIESQKSSYDENSINANAGGNVSIGGSTNTIGKAEVGLSGGGGNLYKKGETVAQSGIKSGGNLNVAVGKDVNITGGVLGSETGEGSLKVGGNLNVKDITTTEKQGGAHITVSGGFSGDMGVDGTIGDKLDKQVTSKGTIGLNSKNIEVGGDITLNGKDSSLDNINSDLKNSQVVDKEVFEQGGDISLSGSTSNVQDVKDKVHEVKNKFNGKNNKGSLKNPYDNEVKISKKELPINPDGSLKNPYDNEVKISKKELPINPDGSLKNPYDNKVKIDYEPSINKNEDKKNSYDNKTKIDKKDQDNFIFDGEKNIDKTLKNQDKILKKGTLDANDKYKLSLLEQELRKQIDEIKKEILDKNLKEANEKLKIKEKELLEKLSELEKLSKLEGDINSKKAGLDENKSEISDVTIKKEINSQIDVSNNLKNSLKETDIKNELNNPYFKNQYETLEKLEQKLQKEKEKIDNLFKRQEELSSKELNNKTRKELNELEKKLKESNDKIQNLQFKQEVVVKNINILRENLKKIEIVESNGDVTLNSKKSEDKYNILDKENAFDFPQDDGVRVDITDRANESEIVPEYYEPLGALPQKEDNKEEKIYDEPIYDEIRFDNSSIVKQKLEKKLESLLKKQEELSRKEKLDKQDKIFLEGLEQEITITIKDLNKIKSQEKLHEDLESDYADPADVIKKANSNGSEENIYSQIEEPIYAKVDKNKKNQKKEEPIYATVNKVKKADDKYSVLDKENAFDFPKDDGVRVDVTDRANEDKIVPEHYEPLNALPRKKSTRREGNDISGPLPGSVVIDGVRQNKSKPSDTINKKGTIRKDAEISSPVKNQEIYNVNKPLVIGSSSDSNSFEGISPNNFLGNINTKENNQKLAELSEEFHKNGVTDEMKKFFEKEDNLGITSNINKELLSTILGTQEGAEGLSKIYQSNIQINQDPNNPAVYEKLKEGLKQFDSAKNKAVTDIMLNSGLNVYVSITDIIKDKNGKFDVNNLYSVFDKNNPEFNSQKNSEIRDLLNKHLDKDNLKLTVNGQVISLPQSLKEKLKNQEVFESNKDYGKIESDDKYNALDKENAFDLPKDDGVRVDVTDRANEDKIVPEHYEPLNAIPTQNSDKADRERLQAELDALLSEQNKILNNENLTEKEKENLNKLEGQTKVVVEKLNEVERKIKEKIDRDKLILEEKIKSLKEKQEKIREKGNLTSQEKLELSNTIRETLETQKILNDLTMTQKEKEELGKLQVDSTNDKYNALDKENAFDLPQDDGVRVDITDRANESEIVPEYYYPLGQPKPEKEFTPKEKELEKKYSEKIDDILSKQKELVEKDEKYLGEPEALEKKLKKVLEEIENDVKLNGDVTISSSLKEKLDEKLKEYVDTKEKYFSGKEQTSKNINEDLKIITRSEKDIRENISSISKEIDKLPKEHVLKYLENTFTNSNSNIESYANYLKGEKDVILRNPKLKNDETTERNIYNIYNGLLKNESTQVREDLDRELTNKFLDNKNLKKLLSENTLNEKNVKELFEIVQKNKKEVYEERLNESYKELPLVILPPNENPNILGENNGKEVKVYLNKDATLQEVFETLVHEMTHQDQNTIIESMNPEVKIHSDVYYLNSVQGGYLTEGGRFYREQPVEKEAFESAEKIVTEVLKDLENSDIYDSESSDSDSDDEFDFSSFVKANFKKNVNSNESNIVNKYNMKKPLPEYRNPPSYKESTKNLEENSKKLQSDIDSIQKDIDRVNKIKSITGGDFGIESTLDMLNREKFKKEQELSKLDKKSLADVPKENQDKFKNLSQELDNLLKKQEEISNKGLLTNEDRNNLDNIENHIKEALKDLSQLNSQEKVEDNPQDVNLKQTDKDEFDFDDNDSIWENRLEEKIGNLLSKQKELSEKEKLSKKDKKALKDIEKKLRDTIEELKLEIDKNSEIYKKNKKDKELKNPKPKKEQKIVFANGDKLIKRSEDDIRKNLKEVSKYSDKIPQEHLLNYLENIIKNKEFNTTIKTIENRKGNIIVANPLLNNDISTEKALDKIYKDIYNREDTSFRNDMDTKFYNRIIENKEILSLLKKDKLSKEDLNVMIKEIKKLKGEVFKETFGKDLGKIKFEVHNYDPKYEGGYKDGEITLHWNPNEKPLDTLKTLIHEMTHAEQDQISKFEDGQLKNISKLYGINAKDGGYLTKNEESYRNQPLEKEAHKSEDEIGEKLQNKLKESDKYNVLDKDNAFDLPQDDGVRVDTTDRANESEIVPEHYEPLGTLPKKEVTLNPDEKEYLNYLKGLSDYIVNNADGSVSKEYVRDIENQKEHILKVLKDVYDNNDLNKIKLTKDEEKALQTIIDNIKKYDKLMEKNYPDLFPKPQPSEEVNVSDSVKVISRNEQDIRDNLKKVAEYSDKIPPEHLANYLENLLKNKEYNELTDYVIDNATVTINPYLNNDIKTEENLNIIYSNMLKNTDSSVRKELDNALTEKLSNNKELEKIIKDNKVNEEILKEIINIVQSAKKEIFENLYGERYKTLPVKIKSSLKDDPKLLGTNNGKNIELYFDKNSNTKDLKEYIKTIIHELAHQDQNNIVKSKSDEFGMLKNVFEINSIHGGYIKKDDNEYKKQPIEKDAYTSEKITTEIIDNLLSKESDKYNVLDKDNAFDLPQDDGVRVDITDRANESEIVPEYYEPLQGLPDKFKNIFTISKKVPLDSDDRENLKLITQDIETLSKEQDRIIKEKDFYGEDAQNLENVYKELKDDIGVAVEEVEDKYKNLKEKNLKKQDKELIKGIQEGFEKFEENREKYFSGSKEEKISLENGSKVIIRSEKDIRNNIDTIVNSGKNIPNEHLMNYLKDTLANESYKNQTKDGIANGNVYLKNPVLKNDLSTEENLLSIYDKLEKETDFSVRKELDKKLSEKLKESEEIKNVLRKDKLSKEEIIELAEKLKEIKKGIYKETLNEDNLDYKITFKDPENPLDKGGAGMTKDELLLFFNPDKVTPEFVLETLIHETTHNDQFSIINSKNENLNKLKDLYNVNTKESGYLKNTADTYIYQPVEKDAIKAQKSIIKDLKNSMNNENDEVELHEGTKKKFKNQKKVKPQKEVRTELSNGNKVIVRGEKDIKNKLKLVAKEADSIPTEHLSNFLGNILANSNNTNSKNNDKNQTIVKNPEINHDEKSAENLTKIYTSIYNRDKSEVREQLNNKFLDNIKNNSEINNILKENNITPENLKKLADLVGNEKEKVFKEVTGKEYSKANVVIKGPHPTENGNLMGNTLTIHTNKNRDIVDVFGTIVHEYTHNDQRNLQEFEHSLDGSQIPYLYNINKTKSGYITPDSSIEGYKNQPLEKEAYDIQKKFLKEYREGNSTVEEKKTDLNSHDKEELKDSVNDIISLVKKQEKLMKDSDFDSENTKALKIEYENFKKDVEQALEEAQVKYGNEAQLKKEDLQLLEELKTYIENFEKNNEKYFSGDSEKKLTHEGKNVIIRSEKDIRKNIQSVSNDANKIPTEHLVNYMDNLITNKDNKKLLDESEVNTTTTLNPILNNDIQTEENIGKILNTIYDNSDKTVVKELNEKLLEKLSSNEDLKSILKNDVVNPEVLYDLANIIQNSKKEIFEKEHGLEYKKLPIKIKAPEPNKTTTLGYNNGDEIVIFYDKNNIYGNSSKLEDYLEVIIHETTHQDQRNIAEINSDKFGTLKNLFDINFKNGAYINKSDEEYRKQPIEKEAYETKEITQKLLKNINGNNKEQDGYKVAYSDNFNKNDGKEDKKKIKYENVETIDVNTGKVIVRDEKEIRNNLKLVSEIADKIPKEHLTEYLKNVIVNKNFAETVKKTKDDKTIENKTWVKAPLLDNNKATEKTLGKIYDKLYSKENKEIREKLDKDFIERLEKNQKIDNLLKKDSLTKEEVLEMAKELFYIKKSVYEKNIDQKYRDIEVEVNDYDPKLKGSYSRKTGILSLYYRPTESPLATLKTIAHELTHVDQHTMIDSTTDDEKINGLANIYYVNTTIGGYLEKDYPSYRNQPMEKEAHDIEDVIKRKYSMKEKKESIKRSSIKKNTESLLMDKVDSLTSKGLISDISKDDIKKLSSEEKKKALKLLNDYEKISKNGKEEKLAETNKLLKEMESFYDEMEDKYSSNNEENKIAIEHFPNKSTGNIEDQSLPSYPGFDKNTLIYGASGEKHDGTPRDELVEIINSKHDIPLVADIFLYDFDVKDENDGTNSPLREKAEEFINDVIKNKGEVSEDIINKLISVKDYQQDDIYYFHADRVNKESQKEIVKELLENKEFKSFLKEIYDLNLKLKEFNSKLKDKTLSDYDRIYTERQIDNIIDEIYEIFPKINSIKTIKILDKVLENGGKIYFALDGITTSRDESGKIVLDRKKLSDILYNKNSKYYNTITSQEIRHIYNNHLDKPGLKFIIDSHVITTPIPERITSRD